MFHLHVLYSHTDQSPVSLAPCSGARRLKTKTEKRILDISFTLPAKSRVVDKEEETEAPTLAAQSGHEPFGQHQNLNLGAYCDN